MSKLNKTINRHIFYLTVICLFVFIITFFEIGCPFLYLFSIPCPTCGVTRAVCALLKGDINGYFQYQPFAIPLCISVLAVLHSKLFRHKRILYGIVFLILLSNFFWYAIKMLL